MSIDEIDDDPKAPEMPTNDSGLGSHSLGQPSIQLASPKAGILEGWVTRERKLGQSSRLYLGLPRAPL